MVMFFYLGTNITITQYHLYILPDDGGVVGGDHRVMGVRTADHSCECFQPCHCTCRVTAVDMVLEHYVPIHILKETIILYESKYY